MFDAGYPTTAPMIMASIATIAAGGDDPDIVAPGGPMQESFAY